MREQRDGMKTPLELDANDACACMDTAHRPQTEL